MIDFIISILGLLFLAVCILGLCLPIFICIAQLLDWPVYKHRWIVAIVGDIENDLEKNKPKVSREFKYKKGQVVFFYFPAKEVSDGIPGLEVKQGTIVDLERDVENFYTIASDYNEPLLIPEIFIYLTEKEAKVDLLKNMREGIFADE